MRFSTLGVALFAVGCSSPEPPSVSAPKFDPDAMVAAAIKEFDKNSNGTIEGDELNACPALKASLALFDKNNDKKISADELKARFAGYAASGVGTTSANIHVLLDGQPLVGATVTLTPEACMGGAVKSATGTTTGDGTVLDFTIDGKTLPGLQIGLYRVSVAKSDLPDKLAKQLLGCEIFDSGRDGGGQIEFKLSSK